MSEKNIESFSDLKKDSNADLNPNTGNSVIPYF